MSLNDGSERYQKECILYALQRNIEQYLDSPLNIIHLIIFIPNIQHYEIINNLVTISQTALFY